MKKITLLMLLMTTSLFAQLEGSWSLTAEAGALGVGESPGNYGWWSNSAEDVVTRSCIFDDEYVFNADGSFSNVQGTDTWLENWQGDTTQHEVCGAAIAPHDGSNAATYTVDATAGTVTIVGSGAYIGLAKVTNQGEDGAPTNDTRVYSYVLSADGTTVDFTIQGFNAGVASAEWIFKMTKNVAETPSLEGSWSLTAEAGALGVGESPGNYGWWSNSAEDVVTRSCIFDDEYVFNADGSFSNVQGTDTWLENWQGDTTQHEVCGAAIAPHDGSNAATYTVDATAGTVTIVGSGAYIGLAKVTNQGEDGAPTNDTTVYSYVLSADGTTVDFTIQGFNAGVASAEWIFKMTKNSDTAGLQDFAASSVKMFPNPASDVLKFSSASNKALDVAVYDLLGKQVLRANAIQSELNISSLNPGMYFVNMTQGSSTSTKKLLVK